MPRTKKQYTVNQALLDTVALYSWCARTGKSKSVWPEWAHHGGARARMRADNPACEYVAKKGESILECTLCQLKEMFDTEIVDGMEQWYCIKDKRSPLWQMSMTLNPKPERYKIHAKTVVKFAKKKLKEMG